MKNQLSPIASRANELSATMSPGQAVHAAIAEARHFGNTDEIDAAVVSAELTNWLITPKATSPDYKPLPLVNKGNYDPELQAAKCREANARRRAEKAAKR